jgi:hypothetical protein
MAVSVFGWRWLVVSHQQYSGQAIKNNDLAIRWLDDPPDL